ncbi:MAG: lipopolysaccharide heptosyltransferase II [bacterium]|nr:lipopolysaccharide heptosyltransferase II [bacterium]
MDPSRPRSILVRAPNWAGDVVMSTPGLRALRASFERSRIVVQVRPGLEGILSACPYVDEVRPVRSYHQGLGAMLGEARTLRADERFDLGICIPESFSSALLQRMAGVRHIVGYGAGARSLLLHRGVDVPEAWGARRLVAREIFVLGLMEAVGCQQRGTHLELFTTTDEEERIDALLRARGVATGEAIVALAPGASFGPSKCWPAASFARVGDRLAERGARIALIGAPSESPLTAAIAGAMSEPALDLAGAMGLAESKALIRRSKLLVCNDAGARHIAVAFGVPAVVLFGPTAVEKTNLNLEGIAVLETADSCRPCYERQCPSDHRCMTGIAAAQVLEQAEKFLEASP